MHRQISINEAQYIPTLYREQLHELARQDEEDGARIDDMVYINGLLNRVEEDWLLACYQEGLMMISELRFFLGLTDNVPSIVGGEAPYMEDILDMEVVE